MSAVQITNKFELDIWLNKASRICENITNNVLIFNNKNFTHNNQSNGQQFEYILESSKKPNQLTPPFVSKLKFSVRFIFKK